TGIAVDGTHIYWANNSAFTIGRANLDGTGVNQNFITDAGADVRSVAVDATSIYWAEYNGSIRRANLMVRAPRITRSCPPTIRSGSPSTTRTFTGRTMVAVQSAARISMARV